MQVIQATDWWRTAAATAEGYPQEPRVARCVEGVAHRVEYPPADDGAAITRSVPFQFTPGT